ncbi:uncharacterized protein PHACADRAFT_198348 [Phanerochaete carnosa HHB-10118-sp]|uniref:Retrotransposon gag domain-containing protein n=1 Tax=Phanerochaete carnosa (strain HHB-10118-sp) TaxID=650164 RepID=K5VZP9_PHACS|nr:uncharacterized protein PHACADRAFT_198348 [Phanerochaete carnosa HHB-10118-sp]EKM52285.1 hypothetical protein PHACADRAFT_198348 [Phanerochaete carnosa HHB-10118-sp]
MVELYQIVQKDHETVNEYNVHFNTLIAEAEIVNPDADRNLLQQYLCRLKESLACQLIAHMPINATLSQWQQQALELDNKLGILKHIKNRQTHLPTNSGTTTTTSASSTRDPNTMNVDALNIGQNNLGKQKEEEPTEEEETREAEVEEVEETGETIKATHPKIVPTSKLLISNPTPVDSHTTPSRIDIDAMLSSIPLPDLDRIIYDHYYNRIGKDDNPNFTQ